MLAVLLLFNLFHFAHSVWYGIRGQWRDFLGADGNKATDYLEDGTNWYQMKVKLHGIDYYIPLSIWSGEEMFGSILMSNYQWTLTLPLNDSKTEENKQRRSNQELNELYGTALKVQAAIGRSSISILKQGAKWKANIDAVNANKYHSGSEIMAIFMTIAVKKSINFLQITLLDSSTKKCDKLAKTPYVYTLTLSLCVGIFISSKQAF